MNTFNRFLLYSYSFFIVFFNNKYVNKIILDQYWLLLLYEYALVGYLFYTICDYFCIGIDLNEVIDAADIFLCDFIDSNYD